MIVDKIAYIVALIFIVVSAIFLESGNIENFQIGTILLIGALLSIILGKIIEISGNVNKKGN